MPTLALIPGLILAAFAGTASEGAIREAVREVYAAEEYQLEIRPEAQPEPPPVPAPEETSRSAAWPNPRSDAKPPPGLGGAIQFLLWTTVAVLGVLLAIWISREWAPFWPGGPRTRTRKQAHVARIRPTVAPVADEVKPEFERLAAGGRYGDAVHGILLALQWEIGRRRQSPFAPALTSREILRSVRLVPPAGASFEHIVIRVEGSLYGGEEVDASRYEECAGHYRAVLAGLSEAPA